VLVCQEGKPLHLTRKAWRALNGRGKIALGGRKWQKAAQCCLDGFPLHKSAMSRMPILIAQYPTSWKGLTRWEKATPFATWLWS
jgi:hypothetical protein